MIDQQPSRPRTTPRDPARARLGTVDAEEFERLRPKLEGIAYRMTGSVADAQDVAQDAWIRWAGADRSDVEDPEAYLVRITTRLSLDRLRSAVRRRETYVGPYLPEPVVAAVGGDAARSPGPSDRERHRRTGRCWPTR